MTTPTLEEISNMSVADAKPLIAELSADDLAKLRELETAKGEDKARKGVLDAIDARLDDGGDANEPDVDGLTLEERVARIEGALASGDPTTIAMMFGK